MSVKLQNKTGIYVVNMASAVLQSVKSHAREYDTNMTIRNYKSDSSRNRNYGGSLA